MAEKFNHRKRVADQRKRYTGRVADEKLAWLRMVNGLWEILELPEESEIGPGYRVRIPMRSGRYEQFTLTILTEEELIAFRDFWERAIELALPVVRERDRIAAAAYEKGDDSFRRIYRQPPEFVVRPRAFELYDPSLLDRPTDVSERDGLGIGEPGELRGDSGALADDVQENPQASNDESETDEPPCIREVG